MRIAHILRKYDPAEWGGTETAIYRLAEGLSAHAAESVVFCPRLEKKKAALAVCDPIAELGVIVERFQAMVPICGISAERRREMFAVGGNLWSFELPDLLEQEPELAVIHAHALGRLGGVALTVARRRRLPFVVTIHGGVLDLPPALKKSLHQRTEGLEWGRIFGWWWKAHRVLSDADAIITCNAREAALLAQRQPRTRILVQPHSVPMQVFRTDQRAAALSAFRAIEGRQLVLCVGRIDAVKNQGWLLRQAAQILRTHPNAMLMFVGACMDPVYWVTLTERVTMPEFDGRVALTGGLPPGDPRLIGLLQSASVVVLPSISETFGLVILEAWAAGAAVIASRTTGASALIRHGENGWLFDLNDPLSFHVSLNRALREPELARRTAAAGTKFVEAEFDTRVLAGRVRRLYDELIQEKLALRHSA